MNFIKICYTKNINSNNAGGQPQRDPVHRPPEDNKTKASFVEVAIAVGVTFWVDPYMTHARSVMTQVLEVLGVSPDIAPTVSALACFTVVCAAPTIIRRVLRNFLK